MVSLAPLAEERASPLALLADPHGTLQPIEEA